MSNGVVGVLKQVQVSMIQRSREENRGRQASDARHMLPDVRQGRQGVGQRVSEQKFIN